MKKVFKQTLAIFMTVAMIFTIAPLSGFLIEAEAETISGTFDYNDLKWTFDTSEGILEFTGAGYIPEGSDYEGETIWPYSMEKDDVKAIIIDDDVRSIGDYAFECCNNLTSVVIGDGVTTIGNFAFYKCESLNNLVIGNSVTKIGYVAFRGCKNLTSVTLPDSVKSIGYDAFRDCESLTNVIISDSVTSIGNDVFSGCAALESITVDEDNEYFSSDSEGVLFNKDKTVLIEYPAGNTRETYIIPDSVIRIESEAFLDCENLKNITIPESVEDIGYSAFENCRNLENITIDDFVSSIGGSAFENTKYYNDSDNWTNGILYLDDYLIKASETLSGAVTFKDGTQVIADGAFIGCNKIEKVTIPASVERIGEGAFYGCGNLESVTMGRDSVSRATIGLNAFYDCKKLTEIKIPDTVTDIDRYAFANTGYYNDKGNWVDDVLYIDNHLIKAEKTLSGSYTIKNGTKTIAQLAFLECTGLTDVTIPDSVTHIGGGAFVYCDFKNVTIPDSVISIGDSVFRSCDNLMSATIGNSVKRIGASAFYGCDNLTTAVLPKSLKEIGNGAFGDCSYLTDVFYFGSEDDWKKISIGTGNEDLTSAIIHYNYSPNGDMFTDKTTPLVSVVNTVNGPKLTWKEVEDAEGYYVYRRTSDTSWIRLGSTTETSFTDKTAKSGTDYIYTAKAYNDESTGKYQNGLTIKCLESPTITSIRNSTRGVEVKWEAVNGAIEYIVYRKTRASGQYSKMGTTSSTSFEWQRETSGTTYYYTVRASAGEDSLSSYRAGTKIKYLASPTVSSVVNTVSGVKISWNNIAGASGYYVYRKTSATGDYTKIGTTTSRSFTDTTAKSGTTYYYTVRAYDGSTLSSYRAGTKIKALTSPTVSSVRNNTVGVEILWDNIKGAEEYTVYRKSNATGDYTEIGKTKSTSFVDKTAKSGTTYYYTVRAHYADFISSYRAGSKIKHLTSPTVSSVINTVNGAKVTWDKVTGASGYNVYRRTANGSYSKIGSTTSTNFTDKTAKSGTTYYYTVRAYNGSTLSSYRVGVGLNYLTSPTVSSVTNTTAGVKIVWGKITGASQYYVYRKTSANGSYTRIGTTTSTNFTDKTAKNGTTYYYTVRAYDGSILSSYRAGAKVTRK